MFQSYQSGPAVDVLNAKDKTLSGRFSSKGKTQVFEKSVKGFILVLETPTMKLSLPADEKSSLNLIQPYLVLQILILPGQSFTLELAITDSTSTKRRLIFSSAAKELALTPLHVRIPNRAMLRGQWVNLSIDLISFTTRCFPGVTFRSLDAMVISSYCRIRRIFTMRSAVFDDSLEGALQGTAFEVVPKAFEFPPGVEVRSQLFHAGLLLEDSQETEPTDTDTPKPPTHPAKPVPKPKRVSERTSSRVLKTAVPGAAVKVSTRVPPGTAPLSAVPQSPASMRSSGLMFRSTLTGLSSHPSRYDVKPQAGEVEEAVEEVIPEEPQTRISSEKQLEMQIPECIEEPSAMQEVEAMEEEVRERDTPTESLPVAEEEPLSPAIEPLQAVPLAPPFVNPKVEIDDEISRLSVRESIQLCDSLGGGRAGNAPLEDSLEGPSPAFGCSSENPLDKVNSFRDRHSHPPSARFNYRLQDQSAVSIAEELEGSGILEDSLELVEEQKELLVPSYYRDAADEAMKCRPFTPPFAGLDKSRSYKAALSEAQEEDGEEEVELVLDPVLGCYYDPKTHEYYELRE